jgi:hypothetical protein
MKTTHIQLTSDTSTPTVVNQEHTQTSIQNNVYTLARHTMPSLVQEALPQHTPAHIIQHLKQSVAIQRGELLQEASSSNNITRSALDALENRNFRPLHPDALHIRLTASAMGGRRGVSSFPPHPDAPRQLEEIATQLQQTETAANVLNNMITTARNTAERLRRRTAANPRSTFARTARRELQTTNTLIIRATSNLTRLQEARQALLDEQRNILNAED